MALSLVTAERKGVFVGNSPPEASWKHGGRWVLGVALFSAVYFAFARGGLLLALAYQNSSPVWPATGLAIAGVARFGPRYALGIAIGAFAANSHSTMPWWAGLGIAFGNAMEGLIGAWCLGQCRRLFREKTVGEITGLFSASVFGPLCSATIGVFNLWLAQHKVPTDFAVSAWVTWWVGNFLGSLTVTPTLLCLARELWPLRWPSFKALRETFLLSVLGTLVGWVVFFRLEGPVFLFSFFPYLLVTAALRGPIGVHLAAVGLSALSVVATAKGMGPFAGSSLNEDLLHLQIFLISVALTALTLPAICRRTAWRIPAVVLLAGWGLSGWLFGVLKTHHRQADQVRIEALVSVAEREITQRVATYLDILRGGTGLFAAEPGTDELRWKAYVESLRLDERYPGILGLGVVYPVARSDQDHFVNALRAHGSPEFSVQEIPTTGAALPPLDEQFIVTYVEPIAINRVAQGLDLASEMVRRNTAIKARDSGEPTMTTRTELETQSHSDRGFLLFVPMYRHGLPLETVAQRREAFIGWISASIIARKLFGDAFENPKAELKLRVYSGDEQTLDSRVYNSWRELPKRTVPNPEVVTHCVLAGRAFTFAWNRSSEFVAAQDLTLAWAAACAAMISLLMAGLVISLQSTSRRANVIVAEKTLALRTSEAQTRAIIETALEAVLTLDDRGLITGWNPQARTSFGWEGAEILGKQGIELLLPARYRRIRDRGWARLVAGQADHLLGRRMEINAIHRGGHEFPCELAIAIIRGGASTSFSVFIRDISARRLAEAELVQAKEAAEAGTRAKSEFLATMSHEIRTPMNGVIGFTNLLLGTALSTKQREYASIIEASGQSLLELINSILDLSKIEAGKLELENTPYNLGEIAASVVKLLAPHAAEKKIEFRLDYPPAIPNQLVGDSSRVRQVLLNLIGNALKFTTAGSVYVAVRANDHEVRITVSDTGVGIPNGKLAILFKKFTQADSSTTRQYGGSGLGLAISKRLVELMGGSIGVESTEGCGSSFWFTLPLQPPLEPGAVVSSDTSAGLGKPVTDRPILGDVKLYVLVAEDNRVNQMLVRKYLENWGCQVDIAQNGAEAVALTAETSYDGVFMDCHMPEMDGYSATQAIREREKTAKSPAIRIPIVALTARAMKGDREKCLESGMDGYLVKPIQKPEMMRLLTEWRKKKSSTMSA